MMVAIFLHIFGVTIRCVDVGKVCHRLDTRSESFLVVLPKLPTLNVLGMRSILEPDWAKVR
jgi:hypothetical protein